MPFRDSFNGTGWNVKKCLAAVFTLLLLSGCSRTDRDLNRAMALRQKVLSAELCSFEADITADYGDTLHSFSVSCQGDRQGNIHFTVTKPETIAGITGTVSETGGQLTFDETALQFELLADDQLSPVSSPWIFLRTLRSGYLMNAGQEGDSLRVGARDSYEENALMVDLWLNPEDLPERSEILYGGRKILTLEISDFRMEPGKQV